MISNRLTLSEAVNLKFIIAWKKLPGVQNNYDGQITRRNSSFGQNYMPPTFTAMEVNSFT